MRMTPRPKEMEILTGLLRRRVIVGIHGARRGPVTFFDLESDEDLARRRGR